MRVGKTGGGVGTNQYAVKGRAKVLPTGHPNSSDHLYATLNALPHAMIIHRGTYTL